MFPAYFQKYKELEKSVRVEEIDGLKLVKNLAVKMEEVFRKKAEATRVGAMLKMLGGIYYYIPILWSVLQHYVNFVEPYFSIHNFGCAIKI